MVFLRCIEPVVIQQRDQQLYVTSEPRREWTSITRNTHLSPLNGMAENHKQGGYWRWTYSNGLKIQL